MVNMGQLTSVLNPMGWTVPVVPELDDLTVGGLIMGCGIETSSHIYGLFHRTCTAYELVLADGSVIRATEHDNSELYHAVPWSHGTLGFLVATEVNVIPAQSYVHISYKPAQSRQELLRSFEKEARNVETNQFVEALVFSETNGVVMTGRMENTPTAKVNEIGRFWKPWFYKHVEQFLTVGPGEECMPLRDYYHRHSKSIFWELQHIVPFANNPLFRYLFGWTMPPKISLLKASQTQGIRQLYEQHHTMQDYLVPIKRVGESIDILHKEVQVCVWGCLF
jgi:delta24-sterol reductase